MRVALLISGELRCFEHTWESMKKYIVDPFNADVFIHTWEKGIGNESRFSSCPAFVKHTPESFIKNVVQPTEFVIEDFYDKKTWNFVGKYFKKRESPMFYSIYAANEIKKSHENKKRFKYDVCFRTRPDNLFMGYTDETYLERATKEQTVFLEDITEESHISFDGHEWWCHGQLAHCPDMFAFGSSKVMDKYSEVYLHLPELYKELDGREFYAEELLGHWVYNHCNLHMERCFTKYSFLHAWSPSGHMQFHEVKGYRNP